MKNMKEILLAIIALIPLWALADQSNPCQSLSGDEAAACNTINSSLQQAKTDFEANHTAVAPASSQVRAPTTSTSSLATPPPPLGAPPPIVPTITPIKAGSTTNNQLTPNIYR